MACRKANMNLLSLDFDGVLHRASDSILLNFRQNAPAWEIGMALKAQSRFAWADELEKMVQGTDTAILIHSTWRKRFDDSTMKSFLPPDVASRVISLDGLIEGRGFLSSDDYLNEAIALIQPKSVCVLDDRPEFFYGGKVKHWIAHNHGKFLWCHPDIGVRDSYVQQEFSNWTHVESGCDLVPAPVR